MVLDAGAGEQPYKSLFVHCQYESADFESADRPYANSTYVCDLAHIPVEDARYDVVLFHQVMEHLPDPQAVLKELFRVMRPGGKLIYSAPLFFEPHEEPYDFYRYTQHGVRHLFGEAGFKIERLDWLEGYFGTVAYQMSCMAKYLPLSPWPLSPLMLLFKAQMAAFSLLFHWLETVKKYTGRGYPKNHVAVVMKPTTQPMEVTEQPTA